VIHVAILGSGSRGNAVVVDVDGERLIVDAGFGTRTLARRLGTTGVAPESISAIFLTHEHGDHVSGACAAARKWGWTIYATAGTIAGTPGLAALRPHVVLPGERVALDTMTLLPVRTPHDAHEPVAVVIEGRSSGARIGIAYDLGHVPFKVEQSLLRLDALILEANHDDEMLRAGPYPPVVQDRIAGANGHLSNHVAAQAARAVAHRELRHLVLAHLSAQNNSPELARATVTSALGASAFRGTITVALQDAVTSFAVSRQRRVEQLSLL